MSIDNVKRAVMAQYLLVTEQRFNLALLKLKGFNNREGIYKNGHDWEGEIIAIIMAWNYACKKHDVEPIDFFNIK